MGDKGELIQKCIIKRINIIEYQRFSLLLIFKFIWFSILIRSEVKNLSLINRSRIR